MAWMYYLRRENSDMRIDKLELRDFGQFHDKEVLLTPGINVIYGKNEAGKSTMKDFIVDMLYGIDITDRPGSRLDHYDQRKPIYSDGYAGAMNISIEDHEYQIERNFSKQDKYTTLRDLDSGNEVPLEEEDNLIGTILRTDKSTYVNTLCISQMGASTDKEIAERLNSYIVNMASAKAGDIDAVSAIAELREKKKAYDSEQLKVREQELSSQLNLERDFDGELSKIQEEKAKEEKNTVNSSNEKLQFTPIKNRTEEPERLLQDTGNKPKHLIKRDRDMEMLSNMGKKSFLDNTMVILFIGLLVITLFIGFAYIVPVNSPQIKMAIIGAGIFYAVITVIQILVKRDRLYRLLEEIEIERGFEEAKSEAEDMEAKKQHSYHLRELQLKEERIMIERNKQQEILQELTGLQEQIAANQKETAALDLAIKTIQDLSEEIYVSFGEVLNEQVSAIVRKITNHRYTEVKIDDQLKVMVRNGNSYISMEYLSAGTIEQIYLALRLAIANVLVDEELPIVMDDI